MLTVVVIAAAAGCDEPESNPGCIGADCACFDETPDRCGDGCVDLDSDPAHCGACGHDCGGGACLAGLCDASVLAVVPGVPGALVVDGDRVVFATAGVASSSGAVYQVPAAPAGAAPSLLYRGLGAAPSLAIVTEVGPGPGPAPGAILVADSGQLGGCTAASSGGDILALSGGAVARYSIGRRCARWLLPRGGGVTWVEDAPAGAVDPVPPALDPWIAHLPSGAAPDAAPELRHERRTGLRDLAWSGGELTWSEAQPPAVVRMPDTGGKTTPLLTLDELLAIDGHAVDAERLVYVRRSLGEPPAAQLVVRSRVTGNELTLVEQLGKVRRLVLDASFVYWIEEEPGEDGLWAVDVRTSVRRRLARGAILDLVQDDRFVYLLRAIEHGVHPRTEALRLRKPDHLDAMTATGVCRAPHLSCDTPDPSGESCYDGATDPDHCGACNHACATGEDCVAGACTCAPTSLTCGGACIDPATDPANCGACGRSCGAGACLDGDCAPVLVGEPAQAFVQDAIAVYYAIPDRVKRLDKLSHVATPLGQYIKMTAPNPLAVDTLRIYVATNATVWSQLKDNGASIPVALHNNRVRPRHLAITGDNLLWIEDASEGIETPLKLVQAAANGNVIRNTFSIAALYPGASDDTARDLIIAGSTAYLVVGDPVEPTGAVLRLDLAPTPTLSLLATLPYLPESVAVAGARLFIATRSPGALISLPTTPGGTLTLHASNLVAPGPVKSASDGSIYWVDGLPGRRVVRHLAPTAAASRIVQPAPSSDGPAPLTSTLLLVSPERLYTASPDPADGIFMRVR